eukprot:UN06390
MTDEPNPPESSMTNLISSADDEFVSTIISLKQTNPQQINYTIYVKIIINPNGQRQEVDFSYKPDEESLASVIDEMVDALELNQDLHYKIIINSILNAMKTKQMKIVPMPIQTQQQNDTFTFVPLSPLVVSPRTIHRKSIASFPDLRSNSITDSDAISSLLKEVKFANNNNNSSDDTYGDDDDELYNYLCSKDSSKSPLSP